MVHPLGWWGGSPLGYHPTVLLWEGRAADEKRETENDGVIGHYVLLEG